MAHQPGGDRGLGAWVRRRIRTIDGVQRRRPWLAVPVAVVKKFGDDRAGSLAALIAYYGFFSVFPLLLVFVTVLGFALGSGNDTAGSVLSQFPIIGAGLRNGSLRGSGLALAIGIVGSLWAGMGVMGAMQNAMNSVWNVPRKRSPNTLRQLPRSLAMLVVFAIAAIATSFLSGLSGFGGSGGANAALRVLGIAVALALNVGLYAFAFRVLTVEDLHWRTVLPGAILGGASWTALQAFGGLYVATQVKGASQTYGSFALVIGLLSWLYLAAQASLFAAELNVVLARRLWPRSLAQPPLSPADRGALRTYGAEEERVAGERVDVTIDEGRTAPTAGSGTGR
jgi:YihY family inner membrane protein